MSRYFLYRRVIYLEISLVSGLAFSTDFKLVTILFAWNLKKLIVKFLELHELKTRASFLPLP